MSLQLVSQEYSYLDSHPWLTLKLSLVSLNFKTWMKLGEAQSKCDHIAGVPLLPYMAQDLHRLYFAKGVQATTAIEVNTLLMASLMV